MVNKSRFLGGSRKLLFTRANEYQDINVGDSDYPMERLQDEFGVDIFILHLNAWQFLLSALKSEKYRDIIFRVNTSGAAWRSLVDTYSLKTQGASLTLLQKLDRVRIGTNDDQTLKLLEMEDIARSLRSSHSQWKHLTESYVIGNFVNALPREHNVQKQMLEEKEDKFFREAVVSSVQKGFDSSVYKQLRRSKPKSGEDQTFAVTGGGKNHPRRCGSRYASRKPGGSQGGHVNGGSGGRGFSGGGASSGSSSAVTAKPGGRTCWVCKSDQHYVRDCPKQIFQGCGERGNHVTRCGKMENAVMAVDILGRTSKDDEADVEAYTTLEIETGERLVSMMEEGRIRQMGDICGLLTQGLLFTLRMILDYLRIMLSAVGCYVLREVTLSRSWGPVLFVFPFDLGRGWSM